MCGAMYACSWRRRIFSLCISTLFRTQHAQIIVVFLKKRPSLRTDRRLFGRGALGADLSFHGLYFVAFLTCCFVLVLMCVCRCLFVLLVILIALLCVWLSVCLLVRLVLRLIELAAGYWRQVVIGPMHVRSYLYYNLLQQLSYASSFVQPLLFISKDVNVLLVRVKY